MMQAMAAILRSAGFTPQDADDDHRPYDLRVISRPVRACRSSGRLATTQGHDQRAGERPRLAELT